MADTTISITIPEALVPLVLASIEHYIRARDEIDPEVTFTPAMAKTAIKQQCLNRIRELVLVYRQDVLGQAANQQAKSETEALTLS